MSGAGLTIEFAKFGHLLVKAQDLNESCTTVQQSLRCPVPSCKAPILTFVSQYSYRKNDNNIFVRAHFRHKKQHCVTPSNILNLITRVAVDSNVGQTKNPS